jgi:hypothetical protein
MKYCLSVVITLSVLGSLIGCTSTSKPEDDPRSPQFVPVKRRELIYDQIDFPEGEPIGCSVGYETKKGVRPMDVTFGINGVGRDDFQGVRTTLIIPKSGSMIYVVKVLFANMIKRRVTITVMINNRPFEKLVIIPAERKVYRTPL